MIGKMFVSAVLAENSVANLLQHGKIDHLFKGTEVELYEFVRDFAKQYQALPSEETIEKHTGETLVQHKEPSGYYFDLMQARHVELSLKKGMKQVSDLLLPENKDPQEALRVITETAMQLISQRHIKQIVDFREAYGTLMSTYASKFNAVDEYGLQLGWPTLDRMSGGMERGDVLSMIGRPAAGKSLMLLYGALHGWRKAGEESLATGKKAEHDQSRMFVSMEMDVLAIQQRLAAMQVHVSASQLKHAALSSKGLAKLKQGLTEIKGYSFPFYVVDGNLAATVEDIWMIARQLKPAAIFLDGAYLVKHPTERDRYRRVAENAELIKSELSALAPVVCSWQFARSASKKNTKKGEKAGLEDIGYSDAIAQVASIVLGLFEDESVETLKHRKIEILKGRAGEVGSFTTRWSWGSMDFSEVEEESVADLQFV
ncbi:MAG: hypothetical protein KJZ83_00255 [Burkholderiaceae bacterium]|nr:hypothetical protein [Burkholderiaceae bacterium]